MSLFDTALSFIGGVGDFVGDAAGTVTDLGSSLFSAFDDDSVWGSISSLAGDILLESANAFATIEESEAALQAGKSAAEIYFSNSDLLRDQAILVEGRTSDVVARARLDGIRLLSQQVVGYSKAGVTLEGSPLLVIDETRTLIENEIVSLQQEGQAKADILRKQASIEEQKASNALDEAEFRAQLTVTDSLTKGIQRLFF